jgi:predicted enzyme related to lactoylglutathione lyase
MAIKPRFGFVLEYVRDTQAAKSFYVDILGLTVERDHPQFVQFRDPQGVNYAIASDESMSGGNEPEIYWVVDDAEAAFQELSRRAEVVMPLRQLPYGKVFGLKDPAGRPCYLLEWAKDRPSQAVS